MRKVEIKRQAEAILSGFGIWRRRPFKVTGLDVVWRVRLMRDSSDGMFRSVERWLCVFLDSLTSKHLSPLGVAVEEARARFLLVVVFGDTDPDLERQLREQACEQEAHLTLLSGVLALSARRDFVSRKPSPDPLSFALLREQASKVLAEAPWRKQFQTSALQPSRLLRLDSGPHDALSESDLIRVLHNGSFLLLGDPGLGKTTALLSLAGDLASRGPLSPVFVPLGRYRGNLLELIGKAIACDQGAIDEQTVYRILRSGAFVMLLDGLNEVQDPSLHERLVDELNQLTSSDASGFGCLAIVTGRVHDYDLSHRKLGHLETRRWEIQGFTADLVFRMLESELGRPEALRLYGDLGPAIRDLCSIPLLLNMLLAVYTARGRSPTSRPALYREFVALLLRWGDDRGVGKEPRDLLQRVLGRSVDGLEFAQLAEQALVAVTAKMTTTRIDRREAVNHASRALAELPAPKPRSQLPRLCLASV